MSLYLPDFGREFQCSDTPPWLRTGLAGARTGRGAQQSALGTRQETRGGPKQVLLETAITALQTYTETYTEW